MENFLIKRTSTTPKVEFNTKNNLFEISGNSRPEDVRVFYKPILDKLQQFRKAIVDKTDDYVDNPFVFNFKFNYFNSSSAKFILDILIEINKFYTDGINIQVNWFFEEGDYDMKEVGEELTVTLGFKPQYIMIK